MDRYWRNSRVRRGAPSLLVAGNEGLGHGGSAEQEKAALLATEEEEGEAGRGEERNWGVGGKKGADQGREALWRRERWPYHQFLERRPLLTALKLKSGRPWSDFAEQVELTGQRFSWILKRIHLGSDGVR